MQNVYKSKFKLLYYNNAKNITNKINYIFEKQLVIYYFKCIIFILIDNNIYRTIKMNNTYLLRKAK